ncbi:MAG: serine hydroxymethyltransferase [Firmicutes bacterium]|nr:serine hydroxymethyltransferase [Bacillota bacterium]
MIDTKPLKEIDKEVWDAIEKEKVRQHQGLELIASENYVSNAVLEAVGSVLTNKYAEGYPNARYYNGCANVDTIEQLAIDRLKKLFNCNYANVQAHSGASANMAVYLATLKPGDTILGMALPHGGHLTHGSKASISGKYYNAVSYGVNQETGYIDYEQLEKLAAEHKPKMIVCGASAYSRTLDFKKFGEIAKKHDALLMADIAHIAGLVATGLHTSPFPYADFVTSTTHKTLRGTRGGIIMCNDEKYAKLIDKAIFPGLQGGPLEHVIAGKAVAFLEALKPEFITYQKQVIKNAKTLEIELKKHGIKLVSGGTDNHLLLLDLTNQDATGEEVANLLQEAHITANKNTVPNDKRPPSIASGIRIGTPAITTRGMKEPEMVLIAGFIADIIKNKQTAVERVKNEVLKMCAKF